MLRPTVVAPIVLLPAVAVPPTAVRPVAAGQVTADLPTVRPALTAARQVRLTAAADGNPFKN